jgi:small subunit ribosomal protein S16
VSVKIRLMRVGKRKQPTYRVVVADARSPRDGRPIETIGHYAPRRDPSLIEINADSALAWLRKGAQPTEQAQKLLAAIGVWERFEAERGGPVTTKLSRRRLGAKPASDSKPKNEKKAGPQATKPDEQQAEAAGEGEPAPVEEPAGE